jgi:hypothetical protein
MRSLLVSLAAVAVLSSSSSAHAAVAAGGDPLTRNPWSVGLTLGFVVADFNGAANTVAFLLSIPIEYTFKAGPGWVALRLTFSVAPKKESYGGNAFYAGSSSTYVTLGLPLGVSYKLRPIAAYPFYVWPFLDIGPALEVVSGNATAAGLVQVGAGISYVVHPNVELWFRPLGLGAGFDSKNSFFMYTFLIGSNFRF